MDWKAMLQPHYSQPIVSVTAKKLQSLWAGYGAVNALKVQLEGSPRTVQLIAKSVHPRPSSGISHERKVNSYRCEAEFYKNHAPGLIKATGLGAPTPLLVESTEAGWEFVLTDLSVDFPESSGCLDDQQVRAALDWLAAYHAYFWERPALPAGLQEQGSYWYLDTRRDEFAQIGRSWSDLKAVADKVDVRLKTSDNEFMTCIHGDMKSENLLFSSDGRRCAAYDFQYTGRSYGVRDIVYLFASSVDSSDLTSKADAHLDHYRSALAARLAELKGEAAAAEAMARYHPAVMRRHFDLALLDYVRFMAGWGMWGSGCDWATRRAKALLAQGVEQLLRD
ncbi:hypothetical protein HYH02_003094 [Chlamydomonas schloesseri]|uniref:CHK kinase-like domain-containing protein n=1 Tax=Chlamydomonas schloesseri TaxID=2026947 RepID=A0A835WRK7_9CHLO|nr:hypothetical protein HYH02_003094 [Chlamydomonas schloesseri]|eukprot:KAG2452058.1 hypothetical protein HYH02_003094 [Chlamydomonas schloesseri]